MNKKLGMLATIHYGKSPSEVLSEDGLYPIIGTGGQYGLASKSMFTSAVVVPRKGSLGNPQLIEMPFWPVDTTYAVIPHTEIDVRWLYYNLLNFDLTKLNEATGVPSISRDWLSKIEFNDPGYDQQNKIATILTIIDQTIEKTETLIHKYQQIKAGLMHDLFTRGVTKDGKLRPPREQAPELYKETPIGWIPRGWDLVRASNICHPVTKGTTPSNFISSSSQISAVPYIRVENLSFNGSFQFDRDSLFVSSAIHNSELARSKVFAGDILMNIVGPPLGKVSLITDEYEEWNTNQAVAIYRVLNQWYRSYLLYYLLSDFAQKWFYLRSKQTSGQVNLTLEMCSNLEIPLPKDETELTSISNILAQVSEKINVENNFRIKLLKKKSGLMHDLLKIGRASCRERVFRAV